MKSIILSTGHSITIDDIDSDLCEFLWTTHQDYRGNCYAVRKLNNAIIFLHRIIHERISPNENPDQVDHKDRNTLNCARANLRAATVSQNNANHEIRKDSQTGYKGVTFHNRNKNYVAYIRYNKQRIHLGSFKTPEEAALAYNQSAKRLFGEFACLNEVSNV